MAIQYTTVAHPDIGRGIDQKSPENRIPDGYCEDMLNMVPTSSGTAYKRQGYQGVSGLVPLRTQSIAGSAGATIIITFDSSVSLDSITARPVVVACRVSESVSTIGDFDYSGITVKYYDEDKWSSGMSNVLVLTDTSATTATDTNAEVTVWGIDPAVDIDNLSVYRREAESTLMCALAGNLFSQSTSTDYKLLSSTIDLTDTIDSSTVIGPALFSAVPATSPTRGYYSSTGITSGQATITNAEWVSGTNVEFTLSTPSRDVSGTPITTSDWLTVSSMGYTILNGTFLITGIDDTDPDELVVTCAVAGVTSAKWDENDAGGVAGVWSYPITTDATTVAAADDDIVSSSGGAISASNALTVHTASGTTVVLGDVTSVVDLGTESLYYTRTTDELVLASTANSVVGDMLTIGSYARLFRVLDIDSTNSVVTIDESIEVTDGDAVACATRWVPVDYPHPAQNTDMDSIVSTHRAVDQLGSGRVRSTLIGDSTYLTNGDGPILKFDGSNLTRAGLIPWHPGCWLTADYRIGSIAPAINPITYTASSGSTFTVAANGIIGIAAGDKLVDSIDNATYIVDSIKFGKADADADSIVVTSLISSTHAGTPTVSKVFEYRYYYRLNLIDTNDNIVASAMAQSSDYRIVLSGSGQIRHKLVGLPSFEGYDFARIECEIYRTVGGTVAPFYRIATIPVDFTQSDGYILFTDTTPDSALDDSQLDLLSSISGQELGNGWEQPPSASYLASTSSRLVAANIESDWRMKLDIRPFANESTLNHLITRNPSATLLTLSDGGSNSQTFEFVDNGAPFLGINERFGGTVKLSYDGNYLFTASYRTANPGIFIFKKENSRWVYIKKLIVNNSTDILSQGHKFGCSSDGSIIVVGVRNWDGAGTRRGKATIFIGENWETQIDLTASDAADNDTFGATVDCSLDGSTIVVGTDGANAAYVYTGTNWRTETILTSTSGTLTSVVTISPDGGVIVLSDYTDTTNTGVAYVYEKPVGGWSTHGGTEDHTLTASDGVANDRFGTYSSCSNDGSVIVVGTNAAGAAYVYSGTSLGVETILTAVSGASSTFGNYVAVNYSGTTVAVGDEDYSSNTGQISIYTPTSWTATTIDTADITKTGPRTTCSLGVSMSFDQSDALAAGMQEYSHFFTNDNAGNYGAVYVYSGTELSTSILIPELPPKGDLYYHNSVGGTWEFNDGVSFTVPTDSVWNADYTLTPPSAGDWIYLYSQTTTTEDFRIPQELDQSSEVELDYCGWWQVASSDTDSFTINWSDTYTPQYATLATADLTAATPCVITLNDLAADFPINTRIVFETDGTIPTGITEGLIYYVITNDDTDITISTTRGGSAVAVSNIQTGPHRIYKHHLPTHWCTAYTSGAVPVPVYQDYTHGELNGTILDSNSSVADNSKLNPILVRRLAQAINATQCITDRTVDTDFAPWMWARAGNDFPQTQLEIHFDDSISTTPTITLGPAFSTLCRMYVDGTQQTDAATVSATRRLLPSRLVASYSNYPEIFDRPFTSYAPNSESAYDINAADGEEITGIAAFFGESAFQGSQLDDYVAVFKRSSVYVVNLNATQGEIKVRRLESHGQGCTAPDSIASTANGIIYANESGMWRLNRDLSITYVGEPMERLWRSSVNLDSLSTAIGFHYDVKNRYQLALPIETDTDCSECYVYDYTREGKGQELGAWTRFDAHDVTAWTNLGQDAYMGTARGGVYSYRRAGDNSDYRDDAAAIDAHILYKSCSFGDASRRKACGGIVTHWRSLAETDGTTLEVAVDLENSFDSGGTIQDQLTTATTGVGDEFNAKVETRRSAVPVRRFNYIQAKLANSTLDEPFELAGIDFIVGGLNHKGTAEPGQ